MLLINLLPPELRKNRGGTEFNPVVLGFAASLVLALLPAGTWAWLKFDRIPAARALLEEKQAILATKTAEAAEVEKLRSQIADFEKHRDLVIGLLAQKMYWARALDQFADAVAGPWGGFEVCCTDLQIQAPARTTAAAATKAKADPTVTYVIKGRFRLVGDERAKSGDYLKAFFNGMEISPFWKTQGLVGKPEQSYRGDTPNWNEEIERVTMELNLDWQRVKVISKASPKGGK